MSIFELKNPARVKYIISSSKLSSTCLKCRKLCKCSSDESIWLKIIYVLNQVFLFDIKKLCMQNILLNKKLICFTGYLKYVIKVKQKLFERFCLLLSHIRLEVRVFMQGK